MKDRLKSIVSVLQEHPSEWMTANDIAKNERCKKWATTAQVSRILSLNTLPGVEYCLADLKSYRNCVNRYRWNPKEMMSE